VFRFIVYLTTLSQLLECKALLRGSLSVTSWARCDSELSWPWICLQKLRKITKHRSQVSRTELLITWRSSDGSLCNTRLVTCCTVVTQQHRGRVVSIPVPFWEEPDSNLPEGFRIFPQYLMENPVYYLKLGHDRFLPQHFQFIIHRVWPTECLLKNYERCLAQELSNLKIPHQHSTSPRNSDGCTCSWPGGDGSLWEVTTGPDGARSNPQTRVITGRGPGAVGVYWPLLPQWATWLRSGCLMQRQLPDRSARHASAFEWTR
jgi:hypothetical protein